VRVDPRPVDVAVLADLEQQLFPEAVRRLRRRWTAGTAGAAAVTAAALAVLGLAALPLLALALVAAGLAAVARTTGPSRRAGGRTPGTPDGRPAQPAGWSTKS
jgi:hypothetical protein